MKPYIDYIGTLQMGGPPSSEASRKVPAGEAVREVEGRSDRK